MKNYIKWYLVGILSLLLIQTISLLLFNLLGIKGSDTSLKRVNEIIHNPLVILITLIISPIVEEFIFRFLIFKKLFIKPMGWINALISSIAFGLIHNQSYIMTIPLVLNGLIYCLIYKKTNKILVPILTHSTYNLLIFLILYTVAN